MNDKEPAERSIPFTLIQFWHDKMAIPPAIESAVRKTAERHPNYTIIFADDRYMHDHIAARYGRDVLDLYRANRLPASRSDLARYMLLHEFGGFYIDAGFELMKSLDTIVDNESDVVLVRRDDFEQYTTCPERAHVIGGIIGATPRNEMIRDAFSTAVDHLKSRKYNHNSWMAAGPNCLNLVLETHQKRSRIRTLSFTALSGDLFRQRCVPGVSNSWVGEQEKGILPEDAA